MLHLITRLIYIITGNGCDRRSSILQALSRLLLLIIGIFSAFTEQQYWSLMSHFSTIHIFNLTHYNKSQHVC